ncbi:MAG: hypothetical protein ACRD2I_15095, partial [Vicinamibacterales bacterium]
MKRIVVAGVLIGVTVWLTPDTADPRALPIAAGVDRTVVSSVVSGSSRTVMSSVVSGFSRTVFAQAPPQQAVVDTSAGTFVLDL